MPVGLLAIQGAFLDHYRILKKLGTSVVEVREVSDLAGIERLIIPGGESTVMAKFVEMFNMTIPLKALISNGMPVWGICAGCILLAHTVDKRPGLLQALNVAVHRNSYGRQLQSAVFELSLPFLNRTSFPAPFIRAPRVIRVEKGLIIHACHAGDPVFVQQEKVMATTFHPELTGDPVLHEYFLTI